MAITILAFPCALGSAEEESVAASPVKEVGLDAAEPTAAEISDWIAQLGHEAFVMRQSAADRLLAAGLPARMPLEEIADGPDPESRAAARRLIA
jgi:hypothetical protein